MGAQLDMQLDDTPTPGYYTAIRYGLPVIKLRIGTFEKLCSIGARYTYVSEGGTPCWKLNKGFHRAQYASRGQVLSFVRDFIHKELVVYLSEEPTECPCTVITMKKYLEDVEAEDLPNSRWWSAVEQCIITDFFKTKNFSIHHQPGDVALPKAKSFFSAFVTAKKRRRRKKKSVVLYIPASPGDRLKRKRAMLMDTIED